MPTWPLETLRQWCRGHWIGPPPAPGAAAHGLSTDTRTLRPGEAFLALSGPRFDGHRFLGAAREAGAAALIVNTASAPPAEGAGNAPPILAVPDTRAALTDLATGHRQALAEAGTVVIAITGSNGKTSTRRLLATGLATLGPVTESPASFNNAIGVPLTLLAASPGDRFVVAEAGTSHPGEIARLGRLLAPDAAILTTLGAAHIGAFGSLEAIAAEKASLLEHVRPGGLAVVPGDGAAGARLAPHLGALSPALELIRFGRSAACPARLLHAESHPGRTTMRLRLDGAPGEHALTLPFTGLHHAQNALAALACACRLGGDPARLARALALAAPPPGRLTRHVPGPGGPAAVLDDTYNASPESLAAALEGLAGERPRPGGRRVLVLGDMLELGESAEAFHREAARAVAAAGVDRFIGIGPLATVTAAALEDPSGRPSVSSFPEADEAAIAGAVAATGEGDLVLVKASRGMRLERVVERLLDRGGRVGL